MSEAHATSRNKIEIVIISFYRSITGWGCDYSPHRRAFVRLSLQEIREHVISQWEARLVQLTFSAGWNPPLTEVSLYCYST